MEGLELEDLVWGEAGGEGDGDFVVGVVEGGGHFAGGGGVDAAMLSLAGSGEDWSGDEKRCCSELQECCREEGSHHVLVALQVTARLLSQLKHCPPPAASLWREACSKAVVGVQMRFVWLEHGMDGGGTAASVPTVEWAHP